MMHAVILTGASRGLGAATALWLAKKSASVTLLSRSSEDLLRVADSVRKAGGNPFTIAGDITDPDVCAHAVTETLHRCGRIDALINNAGEIRPLARIADTQVAAWRYNIELNLMAPFYLVQQALPALRQTRGRVINVSSGAASKAIGTWSAYCASKAALTHFTRILNVEEPQVTAIAFRPGVVDTAMQAVIREDGHGVMPTPLYTYFNQLKAEGQLKSPDVPAQTLAWLALQAPKSLGGEFLDFDDPHLVESAKIYFNAP
jgi:NAD(P)-dependent dehydrogenase (short-subunit alcohol dehydrogenase family)